MTVVELKNLIKSLGGKPGNLKKSDLILQCLKITFEGGKSNSTVTNPPILNNIEHLSQEQVNAKEDGSLPYLKISTNLTQLMESGVTNKSLTHINNKSVSSLGTNVEWKRSEPLYRRIDNQNERSNQTPLKPVSKPRKFVPVNSHRYTATNTNLKHPIGSNRDSRFRDVFDYHADMDITFLGTASCIPTVTRGVSAVAFRYLSDIWLFDCGESSQIQLQKSKLKMSKIKKIFLSHTHGDHSFGLFGVLCSLGLATGDERSKPSDPGEAIEPIDIYGPEGVRDLIRAVIQLTYSRAAAPHRIHELKDVPYLHSRYMRNPPPPPVVRTRLDSNYGEVSGSTDIYPDSNGIYTVFQDDTFQVKAAPMQHSVPCVGYVVSEADRPGALKPECIMPIIQRNADALIKMYPTVLRGSPQRLLSRLKSMKRNQYFTFPDGTVAYAKDFLEPPSIGRKVVILGDTCTASYIEPLCENADLIIHEATNAWHEEIDIARYSTYSHLERDCVAHGHSTPEMAAQFAAKMKAKRLVLTHFSPRYGGDDSEHSMRIMWRIEEMAQDMAKRYQENKELSDLYTAPAVEEGVPVTEITDDYSYLQGTNDVIAAWDQLVVSVPKSLKSADENFSSDDKANENFPLSEDFDENEKKSLPFSK